MAVLILLLGMVGIIIRKCLGGRTICIVRYEYEKLYLLYKYHYAREL